MTCRICYEPGNLIRVCACDGSVKWVHAGCIQQWIDVSHRSTCELCGQPFESPMLRRPIHTKRLLEWCLLGMSLSCLQTLILWFCILLASPNPKQMTVLHLSALFIFIFDFIFFLATLVLWTNRKRALPFIVSYFLMFTLTNVTLQCAAPQPVILPFYVANGCLFVLCVAIDYSVLAIWTLQWNTRR